MQIIRKYDHADHGNIGTVELIVPDTGWIMDGMTLAPETVRHLATFALQTLQDAYAGAKNADDARGSFGKKYDRLIAGTIGTRVGGERNPVRARAIIIAMRHVKVDVAGMEPAAAAKARRAAAVRAIDRNPAYMSLAESQIDAEKALGEYDPDADQE